METTSFVGNHGDSPFLCGGGEGSWRGGEGSLLLRGDLGPWYKGKGGIILYGN